MHPTRWSSLSILGTLTTLEYAQQYTMPKELGEQPNKRRKNVVVITRPFYPPDPAGRAVLSAIINEAQEFPATVQSACRP